MRRSLVLVLHIFLSTYSFSQIDSVLNVFFDVDKYQLNKDHLVQLNELINKNVSIICVNGYADTTGTTAYNKVLSQKRANAVHDYLRKHNTINPKTKAGSFGEQQLINEDISYNRRVEICFKRIVPAEPTRREGTGIDTIIAIEPEKIVDSAIKRYELSRIYFVPDKAIIEAWSFYAIDDAAKYLKNFPGCQFEIIGHVNYAMTAAAINNPKLLEPAQKLSEERARAVYDLLIEREIPATRMTFKGVGNTQLFFKNPKSDEEKRKNMRVEILIYCKN